MYPLKSAPGCGTLNAQMKATFIFTSCINVVKINSVRAFYFNGVPPTYLQS